MALYGGRRDISLFRHLNRELLHKIAQTDVGVYKVVLNDSTPNLYGENDAKVYYAPLKVPCWISREEGTYTGDEKGMDYTNSAIFAFLRDDLVKIHLFVDVGDIILWDNEYFEVDALIENQYTVGKNPETHLIDSKTHGWSVAMKYLAHLTKRSSIPIVNQRGGFNKDINTLPDNI